VEEFYFTASVPRYACLIQKLSVCRACRDLPETEKLSKESQLYHEEECAGENLASSLLFNCYHRHRKTWFDKVGIQRNKWVLSRKWYLYSDLRTFAKRLICCDGFSIERARSVIAYLFNMNENSLKTFDQLLSGRAKRLIDQLKFSAIDDSSV